MSRVPRWGYGLAAFTALFALLGAAALVIERLGPSAGSTQRQDLSAGNASVPWISHPSAGPGGHGLAVLCITGPDPPPNQDPRCDLFAWDDANRVPLSADETARLAPDRERVDDALRLIAWCGRRYALPPDAAHCPRPAREHTPAAMIDPPIVLAAFAQSGIGGATARWAARPDPALTGSTIYAVPAGAGCVVGSIYFPGTMTSRVVGRLRVGGGCLPA